MVSSYRNLICSLAAFTQGSQLGKNVNSGWSIFITREIQNNFVELNLTRDENWPSLVHVFSRARPFRILLRRKQNTYFLLFSSVKISDKTVFLLFSSVKISDATTSGGSWRIWEFLENFLSFFGKFAWVFSKLEFFSLEFFFRAAEKKAWFLACKAVQTSR